jgi:DNA-directed RNA polymerase subunit beta
MLNPRETVDLIDVSPKQLVSVAASLIPFLGKRRREPRADGVEHDAAGSAAAASRCAAGGHGIEGVVARDSGAAIMARRAGIMDQVDAQRIVVRATEMLEPGEPGVDIYRLRKFKRSNQSSASTSARW